MPSYTLRTSIPIDGRSREEPVNFFAFRAHYHYGSCCSQSSLLSFTHRTSSGINHRRPDRIPQPTARWNTRGRGTPRSRIVRERAMSDLVLAHLALCDNRRASREYLIECRGDGPLALWLRHIIRRCVGPAWAIKIGRRV